MLGRGTRFRRGGAARSSLVSLGLVLAALPTVAVGESWHREYEKAQQHLVEGRAAEAEAGLLGALALRPKPGCRLRTYGVKVRDYTPWYYLGVALSDLGRIDEAREAFERSVAEGVVQDCPGTQLQALDLLDRLDRLEAGPSELPSGPGALASLREAALEIGAERFARSEVEDARAAEEQCGPCPRAVAAWLEALSRARVDGPILLLLERSAREALVAAELALRRQDAPAPAAVSALQRARAGLVTAAAARDWLAVEAQAEAAASLARPQPPASRPPPTPPPLASALAEAIARAEAAASGVSAGREGARVSQAARDLARARTLAKSTENGELEKGLELAERARAGFVRQRGEAGRAEKTAARPALIELARSERARVSGRPLLPTGEAP